ncbi:MAG: helix-turn-helix transcriptional regulator [Pseudomonadota bacterium]
METRIREIRREKGWTLQDLAERIGTTAQTVQRLETQNMTVSTDWLEKFGEAFGVDPVSLFGEPGRSAGKIRGVISGDGTISAPSGQHRDTILIDPAICRNPLVFWAQEPVGTFRAGAYIAVEMLEGRNIDNALGLDAVVAFAEEDLVFGRIIRGEAGRFTVVPPMQKADIWYDRQVVWAGKPVAVLELI